MEIIRYDHEEENILKYVQFIQDHYKEDIRTSLFVKDVKKQLSKNNPFFKNGTILNFLIIDGIKVVGHCSAIIDNRNKDIGLIGFYDCVQDSKVSDALLDDVIAYLKKSGCKLIRGPINLSIWHNYRFISKNKRNPTIFDPFCKEYYIDFWLRKGFKETTRYISAIRTDFDYVIPYTKEAYDACMKDGFVIRQFNRNSDDLRKILTMANSIFEDSWNYVKLSYEEFEYLYEDVLNRMDTSFFEIIEDKNTKPIGFCFTLINPLNKDQLILKTIGILEEYRQKHLGAALLYSQHKAAKEKGFKEFYYPLIRAGNNVTKLPYGGYEIITEYAMYELNYIKG